MAKIEKNPKRKFGQLTPQKFEFQIFVREMRGHPSLEGKELRVSWTRGAKITSTTRVVCGADGKIAWDESLTLSCTMYRTSGGKYQVRNAKLSVREKAKNQVVAKVQFDMGKFVSMLGSQEITMPLTAAAAGSKEAVGEIDLTIGSRFIPPGESGEYTEMTAMDFSEMTAMNPTSNSMEEEEEYEQPVAVDSFVPKVLPASLEADIKRIVSPRSAAAGEERIAELESELAIAQRVIACLEKSSRMSGSPAAFLISEVMHGLSNPAEPPAERVLREMSEYELWRKQDVREVFVGSVMAGIKMPQWAEAIAFREYAELLTNVIVVDRVMM